MMRPLRLLSFALLLALPARPALAAPDGHAIPPAQTTPPPAQVVAGIQHTCAITAAGGVMCWGGNYTGQLGDGTLELRTRPVPVSGLSQGATALTAGPDHTCAVVAGRAWCWGSNGFGMLGDGTINAQLTPVAVAGLGEVTALAAGLFHTCALTRAGAVQCWGHNDDGQLGDGTLSERLTPGPAVALPGAALALAAGDLHTCALLGDGTIYCWGDNYLRQLGNGAGSPADTRANPQPAPVIGLAGPASVLAAGGYHTCAIVGGAVQCWGNNAGGSLGDGVTQESPTPVSVTGLAGKPTGLALGESHSCVLLSDGGVQCWGANFDGQLGNGTLETQPVPVASGLPAGTRLVAAGGYHTCAVDAGGTLHCWGRNDVGQLGDGTLDQRSSPVPVPLPDERYRPAGPLVPEISTHIPTPLDISTDPAVVGTNLLLAALATLLFTVASEVLNQTLAEHEDELQGWLAPARLIGRGLARLERALGFAGRGAEGRGAGARDALRIGLILAIYGVIFSLLDPTWQPLTLTGVWLFLSMALAAGLAGLVDDLAQWQAARRRGVPTRLNVRPANLLLALGSTLGSRFLLLVPGVVFGLPEALDVERTALDERTETQLAAASAGTLVLVGALTWGVTALTAWLLAGNGLPTLLVAGVGGLQSLLLLAFAVTLQNGFLQMLGLPGSFGRALLRRNRWLWAAGLLVATFAFYHTLINPRGDLANALAATNVLAFFGTVIGFVVFTAAVWVVFRRRRERGAGSGERGAN